MLTRSARRFVTPAALAARSGGEVFLDAWPEDEAAARHVEWQQWAQAIVVYPATLNFIARFALGLADTPALLAAQCATVPVVLAPALPPNGLDSAAYQAHWTRCRPPQRRRGPAPARAERDHRPARRLGARVPARRAQAGGAAPRGARRRAGRAVAGGHLADGMRP